MADTGVYSFRDVAAECPSRIIDVGIMEDGMVGIAAGMALAGMIPTIYAMTPFIVERALEQLKLDFIYQKLGGNIITLGAAYDFSMLGYSHYCAEDYAVLQNLPGIEFVTPGTGQELASLYNECADDGRLSYFRMSDYPNKAEHDVRFGKALVIKEGSKATVIAVGTILDAVMKAVANEDVTVLYYTTLSPFDSKTLEEYCENGKILICEPQFSGSLDADVLHCFEGKDVNISHVGLPREIYRNYGKKIEKDKYYGLTEEHIYRCIKEITKRGA